MERDGECGDVAMSESTYVARPTDNAGEAWKRGLEGEDGEDGEDGEREELRFRRQRRKE